MSFLRRLLGGGGQAAGDGGVAEGAPDGPSATDEDIGQAEREYEREVLRAEAERLDDLRQRQLRYAEHAWTPPSEGGERRADDEGTGEGS